MMAVWKCNAKMNEIYICNMGYKDTGILTYYFTGTSFKSSPIFGGEKDGGRGWTHKIYGKCPVLINILVYLYMYNIN